MQSFDVEIEQARNGDPESARRLLENQEPHIRSVIRSRLRGFLRRHYETRDLAQSVVAEVLRDLPRFENRGEPAFRRWLELKARSKVFAKYRRHLRRGGGRRELTLVTGAADILPAGESGPLDRVVRNEEEGLVRTALDGLNGKYQLVLRLRHEEALSYPEVARWMDLPGPDAARKLHARALLRLGRALKRT